MRERTDKSFPNSYNTAIGTIKLFIYLNVHNFFSFFHFQFVYSFAAVCESIKNPVTAEILEDYIERCRYREMMPPPRVPTHF